MSLDAYRALDCRDLSRLDIRLDSKGIPNILEINALPGLIPNPKCNSRFPKAARAAGMDYNQMILTILNISLERYKLPKK